MLRSSRWLSRYGWNKLSWEEKKRSGLISQGFYAQSEGIVDSKVTLEWTPAGPTTAEEAKAMKPKGPGPQAKSKVWKICTTDKYR